MSGLPTDESDRAVVLLEQQAAHDAAEREALRASIEAHEILARRREADEREEGLRRQQLTTKLAETEAELACAKDELALERDILAAVRKQVDVAETARLAGDAQILELRRRLPSTDPAHMPAEGSAEPETSWEALLQEKSAVLEHGISSRQEELEALRAQLRVAHTRLEDARSSQAVDEATAAASATEERLRAELLSATSRLEAKERECVSLLAGAEAARGRVAEQGDWLARREQQLGSARRQVSELQDQLAAAHAAARAAEEAAEAERAANAGGEAGGSATSAALEKSEAAGEMLALKQVVSSLEAQLISLAESSGERLGKERAELLRVDTILQAAQTELKRERANNSELGSRLSDANTRVAGAEAELRMRGVEVERLSDEIGAMRARLHASASEVRLSDQASQVARMQRAHGEREVARLRDEAGMVEELNTQLKQALALESERVARAWEARNKLAETLSMREDMVKEAQTAAFGLKEELVSANDELLHLREQCRLSEILIKGAEERASIKAKGEAEASQEARELASELAASKAQLRALREAEVDGKKRLLEMSGDELRAARREAESQEERVEIAMSELSKRSAEIVALRDELNSARAQIRTLRDDELAAANERFRRAEADAVAARREASEAGAAAERLEKRVARAKQEVGARAEQLEITFEQNKLLTLELTLKDERLRSLDEVIAVEAKRHEREAAALEMVRKQAGETAKLLHESAEALEKERARVTTLELVLAERDERMAATLDDLKASELRGDSRDERMKLLHSRTLAAEGDAQTFESRLDALHARLADLEAELERSRDESRLMYEEATTAKMNAERERASSASVRTRLVEVEGKLAERDYQLDAMESRVSVAKEDLQMQLAMIEEEVHAAKLKLDAKDASLELLLEEATGRERQAHGFVAEVTTRLRKAHAVMAAKDELLASLGARLQQAVDSLRVHEEREAQMGATLRAEKASRAEAATKLTALQERHELVSNDFAVASEALDNYRDSLVSAEVRMRQDAEKVAELQRALRELQGSLLGADGASLPTGSAMLPPLSSAASGAELGASRVHFLYFLASFLLLKTALSAQGHMSNVGAQDVFEEIVRNEVPLEEWPTYIFTRVFKARPTGSATNTDVEVAALKAVAQRTAARDPLTPLVGAAKVRG